MKSREIGFLENVKRVTEKGVEERRDWGMFCSGEEMGPTRVEGE